MAMRLAQALVPALDGMKLWQKFTLLSIVALVLAAIPAGAYLVEANAARAASLRELEGLHSLAALSRVQELALAGDAPDQAAWRGALAEADAVFSGDAAPA